MQTVTVPVIAAFEHQGRALAPGDTVTVAPVEAAALARQGVVSIEAGYQTKVVAPEPVRRRPRDPARPRRQYRRRDLVPEP